MSLALNFYCDQIDSEGCTLEALPAAPRMLFVRHGSLELDGRIIGVGDAVYCDAAINLKSVGEWSEMWRWDLVSPVTPVLLLKGSGVLSTPRMHRAIQNFAMIPGTKWLFRLDQILTPPGRVADRHQHPGPGIRCLVEGTFNVEQAGESYRNILPGEPWWETGYDTVTAWSSPQMAARFMRAMVLPVECEGKVTGTWLSGEPPPRRPGSWKLVVDQIVAL